MDKKAVVNKIKEILNLFVIATFGIASLIFAVLYADSCKSGFIYEYSDILKICAIGVITLITVAGIVFYELKVDLIFKSCYIAVILIALALILLYVLNVTGVMSTINSVEELREYIESMGHWMPVAYVVLQFLQVVILPIPAVLSITVGVLLFGPLKAAVLSFIGILSGSIVAFFIGRVLGYKVAAWLVGKENLDKAIRSVKGKDKAVLTFMFLFPFFPDDVLCFVAGLSSMSKRFFLIMITVTRAIAIFVSCYAYNNSLIPYDTWWGLLIWGAFFALTIVLTVVIYKKGSKIENYFKKKFSKKRKKQNIQ